MKSSQATDRARMPEGANKVLDRRTLETDNRNLLKYLKPGIQVLDVGCGSGAITKGMAEKGALVTGIDPGETLIAQAQGNYEGIAGLQFQVADIFTFETAERYDLISSARVLQWLQDPATALLKMKALLKSGGLISILDYNHEKIQWHPAPPAEMKEFYNAFLKWRTDVGFDNAIADHLSGLFESLGFTHIEVEVQHELTTKNDPEFAAKAGIWSTVAKTRGLQLVKDGYITESQRLSAIGAYEKWIAESGESMTLYLLSVSAK